MTSELHPPDDARDADAPPAWLAPAVPAPPATSLTPSPRAQDDARTTAAAETDVTPPAPAPGTPLSDVLLPDPSVPDVAPIGIAGDHEPAPAADALDDDAPVDADALDDDELLPAEPPPALWASFRALPLTQHAALLTLLGALIITPFVLIQPPPRWLALLGALTVAAAMEGTLHATRRRAIAAGVDTAPFLVLPTMYMLAVPVFIAYSFHGYGVIPAALLGALGLGAIATAQIATVREFDRAHEAGRLVTSAATYFTVFALFSLTYTFDLEVRTAALAVGVIAGLLAVELMHEGEIDPLETLVFSMVCGLVVGEVRVVLYYLPLGGNLAALALLFAFYFVAGILHAHVTRHLDAIVALQYAAVAAAGGALVIGARAAGLG